MAGKKHQFILGLIIRKIREEGYTIIFKDGNLAGSFGQRTDLPPKILRHRPDVIAINEDGQICIGEAKTKNDIGNSRTAAELVDYTSIELNGKPCHVIVGIQAEAKDDFRKLLKKLGIFNINNLLVLHVPDEIIND